MDSNMPNHFKSLKTLLPGLALFSCSRLEQTPFESKKYPKIRASILSYYRSRDRGKGADKDRKPPEKEEKDAPRERWTPREEKKEEAPLHFEISRMGTCPFCCPAVPGLPS